ncbi:dienelactone hydrolase family protein [Ktedonosporobacter rubrisoli]|uniref:Dienelactone hydrolase family protein n=1 Tax=Ktedonosporobacter rubrisoli TaxID=2509675 RepID=A0A4P6JMI8_KTERU|nr:dienelactone hydrolase family protein [Ktedonosporobacter rubrisoli]QBD76353.1 dienelactone hydrolase family protein [Ktedonosporobacter rubrisoli]
MMLDKASEHEIATEHVNVPVDEESATAPLGMYMAQPVEPGSYPGVIVGFELFGLTGYVRKVVERIARLGYVVVAPDFYHRSAPGIELAADAEGRTRGFALLHQLTRQQALNDVRAAMSYLRNVQGCAKLGIVGLSVGGHIAYLAATQLDLKATVAFYAGWLPGTEIPLSRPEPTLALTPGIASHDGYLLFLVGENDALIPREQRAVIATALNEAKVRHELVEYSGAPHGFFCDERESYEPVAAADGWRRLQSLFAAELV